jgi:plastocyanin
MRSTLTMFSLAVLLVATAPTAWAAGATVNGAVTYTGQVPNLKPIAMDADPVCAKKHEAPVANEALVLGSGNTMGNVIVWVSSGLPAGKTWPAPKEPVTLNQDGCMYKPHVMGLMVGQPYKILNSDGILHNVHALPKVNPAFNKAMPPAVKEAETTFEKEEAIFQIKCDVHPWMSAFVGVFANPFFAVTGPDGKFAITGLDPGTYELSAWHEKLGTQKASVTVAAGETKSAAFTFGPPAGK